MGQARGYALIGAALTVMGLGMGCAPATFVHQPAGWKVVELRENLDWDTAWQEVVDTIARDWDIEILAKDSRYLRTAWHFGISGANSTRYRGRVIVKFPPGDVTALNLKTDAEWLSSGTWMMGERYKGYDTQLMRDVYSALSGRVGRTIPR